MFKVNKIIVGLLVVSSLFMASNVFASTVNSEIGRILLNPHAPDSLLTIGLSKGVEARFVNPGTTNALSQWYVVASVHSGGNRGYATAQNLTNIMVSMYAPGSPTADFLDTMPLEELSAPAWPSTWSAQ